MKRLTMVSCAGTLLLCSTLFAAVPQLVNFQAQLKDGLGSPVADGNYSLAVRIYDVPSGTNTALWSDTFSISTVGGLFTVTLGSEQPLPDSLFANPNLWVGVQVDSDDEMIPRTQLTSVPYSARVGTVDGATGGVISGDVSIQSNLSVDGAMSAKSAELANPSPTQTPLSIQGATGQTANLFEIRDNAGTPLVTVNSSGTWNNKILVLDDAGAAETPLTIQGSAGQSVDLLQIWDDTELAARWSSNGGAILNRPMLMNGAVGQTDDLCVMKDGSGLSVFSVGPDGSLMAQGAEGTGSGNGGTISLSSGSGDAAGNGDGGSISLSSGSGGAAGGGKGGTISILAGDGGVAGSGNGGSISLSGGESAGNGGSISITAGGGSSSGNGGTVTLSSGRGDVYIGRNDGVVQMISANPSASITKLQAWQNGSGATVASIDPSGGTTIEHELGHNLGFCQGSAVDFKFFMCTNAAGDTVAKMDASGNISIDGDMDGLSSSWETGNYVDINCSGTVNASGDVTVGGNFSTTGISEIIGNDIIVSVGTQFDQPIGVQTSPLPVFAIDAAGAIHASSFPTSSDERLKENVRPLEHVLEKLERVRGVSFDWNETYEELGRSTGHREIGVIAQEMEKVFPELVTTWGEENYRAVDYGRLSAVLIEAIKALNSENEELRNRILKLEGTVQRARAEN